MFFDKKLYFPNLEVESKLELFYVMANSLKIENCVTEDYLEGITEREKTYPTGLLINEYGIAMPHTDSKYVLYSQICFASLSKPIIFRDMGGEDLEIPVQFVFMLAMKEAHEQLTTLQNLVTMFQNQNVMAKLMDVSDKHEIMAILESNGIQ